jgi:flagellar protein FlaG
MLRCINQEITVSNPQQPRVQLLNTPDYREGYANSVQVRVSIWDFFLTFGRLQAQSTTEVEVHNFQGIYLSPQQAKALVSILEQNLVQYEKTFGEIKLDASVSLPPGQIN